MRNYSYFYHFCFESNYEIYNSNTFHPWLYCPLLDLPRFLVSYSNKYILKIKKKIGYEKKICGSFALLNGFRYSVLCLEMFLRALAPHSPMG
jgi:hypothetical protein